MEECRVVPMETGRLLATELGPTVGWIETSAKTDTNINEAFCDLVRKIKCEKARIREKKMKRKCTIL
jgi:hypothetical protein